MDRMIEDITCQEGADQRDLAIDELLKVFELSNNRGGRQ